MIRRQRRPISLGRGSHLSTRVSHLVRGPSSLRSCLQRPPLSAPPSSLRNGWIVRAVSTLFEDSIRTTVAPQSARTLVDAGPAITHCKSSTFTSDRGKAVPSEDDLAVLGAKSRAISPSNSAFASPRAGGGCSITIGVADIFAEGPGKETVPWSGISMSRQKSRSVYWGSSATSPTVAIGNEAGANALQEGLFSDAWK